MTPLLEVEDLAVARDGRQVLEIEHLHVDAGETLAVLGPNGSGKSTFLRAATLLLPAQRGAVRWEGAPATDAVLRREVAVVLQRSLLRRGSVLANVASGLRFRGASRAEARRAAEPWLERLGIADLRHRSARLLSGGEGQRVSLARALATSPRLLVIDEGFAPLDEATRGSLVLELRALLDELGIAAVVVTHDRREAAALADRTAVLDGGRLHRVGPTEDVLADPQLNSVVAGAHLLDEALRNRLASRAEPGRAAAQGR